MAQGINKVILIGVLGKDPEIVAFENGGIKAKFSLAINEKRKKKNSNEYEEHTEWLVVEAFGKKAEKVKSFVKKGMELYVEGSLTTDKWIDKNNNKHSLTKIEIRDWKGDFHIRSYPKNYNVNDENTNSSSTLDSQTAPDMFDDDIPF